jgi:MFS family permease
VVALAATVALEAGERQSLSQAIDGLQDQFAISDRAIGALFAAMSIVGVAGAFPFGILADRLRRTAMLATAMALWTVCMGLNGLAVSFPMLFATRLGVGAVEANGPAAVSLLSDYYPLRDRARMMGLYQSGALVGALVGLVAGGFAVDAGGWRWAFWMWVPVGTVVTLIVLRQPEPLRGDQDADAAELDLVTAAPPGVDALDVVGSATLPPPVRVGTLDYETCTARDVYRELLGIRSMWFGVMALTISSVLLAGLQAWGVEFFKRAHDLEAAEAGVFAGLFGLGAASGVIAGGFVSDALLRRGIVNARVYVVAAGSVAASVLLVPALLSANLATTLVLFLLGGTALTLPLAPGEALVSDVVVAQLRGRAATMRSVVRSIGALSPLLVGVLSEEWNLRAALVAITPLYAIGGLVMLLAARSYPTDLSFVVAESRRIRESRDRT